MTPKVTVLMTVYNGVAFLREALRSVLDQSFEDFEFLIVDDASTDESVSLIRSYADERIRLVLNETNMGQAASLNKGLDLASGEYIARLDQDDVCLPERLARQVALLDARSDVCVTCTWEYTIDEKGRKVRDWRSTINDFGAYLATLTLGLCPVWHPSTMFRRVKVLELGGYDPSFAPAEDYDLWTRIALARLSGAIVPEFLVLQRVHGGRQSITRRPVQEANTRRAHEKFIGAFTGDSHIEELGFLLRMEKAFWAKCRSKGEFSEVLGSMNRMTNGMLERFDLSEAEATSFKRSIYRRLGLGVRLSMRARALPAFLFFPLLLGLSPMLVSPLQRQAAFFNRTLPELRYPGRILQSTAERLLGH